MLLFSNLLERFRDYFFQRMLRATRACFKLYFMNSDVSEVNLSGKTSFAIPRSLSKSVCCVHRVFRRWCHSTHRLWTRDLESPPCWFLSLRLRPRSSQEVEKSTLCMKRCTLSIMLTHFSLRATRCARHRHLVILFMGKYQIFVQTL